MILNWLTVPEKNAYYQSKLSMQVKPYYRFKLSMQVKPYYCRWLASSAPVSHLVMHVGQRECIHIQNDIFKINVFQEQNMF